MDTLANLERVETDNKDRPIEDLVIQRTSVFVDPFAEADEQLAKERAEETERTRVKEADLAAKKEKKPERKVYGSGVGKFINPAVKKEARRAEADGASALSSGPPQAKKKKKAAKTSFSDFSAW